MAGIQEIAARARQAQREWRRTPLSARAHVISRFHDLILDRGSLVLDTVQSETGKSRRDALAELVSAAGTARYYSVHGQRAVRPRKRRGALPLITHSTVEHRPFGVVGLIVPWNYPFLLSMGDSLPALLAGNAVLVKPSDVTPLSTALGKTLLVESGLDPDLFGIVNGGPEAGRELLQHVDYIGFTGSSANGRKVAVAAAERLIPFSLELGGKNPMIVLKEAPVEQAADALLAGAFANAGQTCISIERAYIEAPVFDRFAGLVADRSAKLRVGWSQDFSVDIGSLIHASHAAKVQESIDRAVSSGAVVLAGARRRSDLGPAFVEPTILGNVDPSSPIDVEETFGPVVSLHRVRNRDEALSLANNTRYGLHASVWAGASGADVARDIEAGSVAVNSTLMIYNSFDVPMGGVKQSGIGRRHGEHGILRYTQEQSIVRSFESGGGYDSLLKRIVTERRAALALRATRIWRKIPFLR